jgi:hypothetical protein
MSYVYELADNETNITDSQVIGWPGGNGVLMAHATSFNSATVTLLQKSPQGVFVPHKTAVSLTANGSVAFSCPPGDVKVTVTGAGSGGISGLFAWLFMMPN